MYKNNIELCNIKRMIQTYKQLSREVLKIYVTMKRIYSKSLEKKWQDICKENNFLFYSQITSEKDILFHINNIITSDLTNKKYIYVPFQRRHEAYLTRYLTECAKYKQIYEYEYKVPRIHGVIIYNYMGIGNSKAIPYCYIQLWDKSQNFTNMLSPYIRQISSFYSWTGWEDLDPTESIYEHLERIVFYNTQNKKEYKSIKKYYDYKRYKKRTESMYSQTPFIEVVNYEMLFKKKEDKDIIELLYRYDKILKEIYNKIDFTEHKWFRRFRAIGEPQELFIVDYGFLEDGVDMSNKYFKKKNYTKNLELLKRNKKNKTKKRMKKYKINYQSCPKRVSKIAHINNKKQTKRNKVNNNHIKEYTNAWWNEMTQKLIEKWIAICEEKNYFFYKELNIKSEILFHIHNIISSDLSNNKYFYVLYQKRHVAYLTHLLEDSIEKVQLKRHQLSRINGIIIKKQKCMHTNNTQMIPLCYIKNIDHHSFLNNFTNLLSPYISQIENYYGWDEDAVRQNSYFEHLERVVFYNTQSKKEYKSIKKYIDYKRYKKRTESMYSQTPFIEVVNYEMLFKKKEDKDIIELLDRYDIKWKEIYNKIDFTEQELFGRYNKGFYSGEDSYYKLLKKYTKGVDISNNYFNEINYKNNIELCNIKKNDTDI